MNNRLKRCMERAEQGEELIIGFFGGSITQGSLASSDRLCYAYRVFQWWENQYPQAKFHYVNGGIGGTNSYFGASRVVSDLLMYNPDVVVVDFSVNDDETNTELFKETFEGLLRKILTWNTNPAVIVLNNVYYDTGRNMQTIHNQIAEYYQVPYVSIKDTVYPKIQSGELEREALTPDNLHPNDLGHQLVAEEICRLLEQVRETDSPIEGLEEIPSPLVTDTFEFTKRLTIMNSSPQLDGFRADPREKLGHLDFFKNGWMGKKVGDRIRFEVEAANIAIQYRKTIHQPAPVAKLIIDGDEEKAVLLDGNFDEDWGDCLYLQSVLEHGEKRIHSVELEIVEADKDLQSEFYLLSLILA